MKVSLIDGRFKHGQTKDGVDLAFYELHKRGMFKKLNLPYEMVFTMDPPFPTNAHWESESKWLKYLSECVSTHYGINEKVVTIGGDHSIGLSTITGIYKKNPNFCLLWIDAHADFNTYDSSITKNLHGMPLNGLVNGWKSIGEIFSWIGEGIIKPERVGILGLRDVDPEEQILLDKSGIRYKTMKDIQENGLSVCLHDIDSAINPQCQLDYHVSFDLDSIDPTEFPSTGCQVPGGISFDDALHIMRFFNKNNKLKSFDIVEYNPMIANTSDCDERLIRLINEGL